MFNLPPLSQILERAYGSGPVADAGARTDAQAESPARAAAATINPPAGHLAALSEIDEAIDPSYVEAAARQRLQDWRNRAQVDTVLDRLSAGNGIPAFHPCQPPGQHLCFRHEDGVLCIARQADFMAGRAPAFEIHLHGSGVMARRDGTWIENLDAAFFSALDAASRDSRQAFVV